MTREKETLKSRFLRAIFNFVPPFRASGARLTYVSPDLKHIQLKLPYKRRTRNYVGTIYGGSMYSAVDGIYMVMLIQALGKDYIVWDKSASIRYKKPAREALTAQFIVTEQQLDEIRNELQAAEKIERDYMVELCSADGTVHAEVSKKLQIRKRAE